MKDHPIRGITFMALAVLCGVICGMFGKMASERHDPVELVFWSNIVALIILLSIFVVKKDFSPLKTNRIKAQVLRGLFGTLGSGLTFWAYALLPMANAVTIFFTGGLMTVALSGIILRENVHIFRWMAVIFGFTGAVIAIAPTGDDWNLHGVLVALSCAFVGGCAINLLLRSIGKTDSALTTVFYFLFIGLIFTTPYVLIEGVMPDHTTFWPLIGCGAAAGIGLILKTEAFRYAEASLLSPVNYTSIIWATIFGWLIWNDWPTLNVFIGATIIIGSNLFIMWREQQIAKKISQPESLTATAADSKKDD